MCGRETGGEEQANTERSKTRAGRMGGAGARELWASPTCLCQHLPNDAQATSLMRGSLFAVYHGVQVIGGGGAHGTGGDETGAGSGCCLCSSATVQTASYSDQMRENERKQICSSQANEYTYKRPTTKPSSMAVPRSPLYAPTIKDQLQTPNGISLCSPGLCSFVFSPGRQNRAGLSS